MWIRNKDSDALYEVNDEKIIKRLSLDKRFEIDVKLEQPKETEQEDKFICEECNKEFKNNAGLQAHNRVKHGGDE
jgi:hypothetical protein